MPKPKLQVYETIFEVCGAGTFPLDMLRYDACMPAREVDSNAMRRAGLRIVRLRRLSLSATAHVSESRWESFGWRMLAGIDNTLPTP